MSSRIATNSSIPSSSASAMDNPQKPVRPDLPALDVLKRRRPQLSCTTCKRKRLRCDRQRPCGRCISRRQESQCTYKPVEIETTGSTRTLPRNQRGNTQSSGRSSACPVGDEITSRVHTLEQKMLKVMGDQDQDLGESASTSDTATSFGREEDISEDMTGRPQANRLLLYDCWPTSNPRSRYFGRSHYISTFYQFEDVYEAMRMFGVAGRNKFFDLMLALKARAPTETLWPNGSSILQSAFIDHLPSPALTNELWKLYFDKYESIYRILHYPSFLEEYIKLRERPEASNDGFVVVLLLVIAIGSCFYPPPTGTSVQPTGSLHEMATKWIQLSQAWLSTVYTKEQLSIRTLQIHCLLLLARQLNAVGGDLIWVSSGSLLRTAIEMGLHREPSQFPKVDSFHVELRRRLWFTILELDIQSSLDSGSPPLISTDDYDCQPPLNVEDDAISLEMDRLPTPEPQGTFTRTSLQIILIKSLPTRIRIARLVNKLHFDPSYEEVLRLSDELTRASIEIHQDSRISSPGSPVALVLGSFQIQYLDLLVRRFMLALHRPFALKARRDPKFCFSRKVSLESSLILLSYQEAAPDSTCLDDNRDMLALQERGGGIFRDEFFHSALSVCLEIQTLNAENALGKAVEQRLARSQWSTWTSAVERTLEIAEKRMANVGCGAKIHVFLSMVLASSKALQSGRDRATTIEQAAIASAEACFSVFAKRNPLDPLVLSDEATSLVTAQNPKQCDSVETVQYTPGEVDKNDPYASFDIFMANGPFMDFDNFLTQSLPMQDTNFWN